MAGPARDGSRDALLALDDRALLARCQVDRIRGPGPGGQKRNKTSSAVRVRHADTGLAGMSGESRSQPDNQARALRRLRERFAFDLREPVELDDYAPPAELAALLTQEPVRKSEKWLRSGEYLRAAGHLLDLYQASGCSLAELSRRLQVSQGRLDKIARADVRLQRKLAELRAALRGRPVV